MTSVRIRLDPMTESEFRKFLRAAVPEYAAGKVEAGAWSPEESVARSQKVYEDALPQGLATPDNRLFTVRDADDGRSIGTLWFELRGEPGREEAYVLGVEVAEGLRGRGYGRATMRACVDEARKEGAASVGLHVFEHNTVARALYTSLGFAETGVLMSLRLESAARGTAGG